MGRPPKNKTLQSVKNSETLKEEKKNLVKSKGLFDHINHIREVKSPDYYDKLTVEEKKSFNKYVLLMGLSMDQSCIEEIAYISKYFDSMPDRLFYTVCCDVVPHGRKFCKWIKANKQSINKELIQLVAKHYQISKSDAYDYCIMMIKNEKGLTDLINVCKLYGKTEKELEKLFDND